VSFDCTLAVLRFDLRQQHDTGSVAVSVLRCEQVVHFDIVVMLLAHLDELLQQCIVVDATQRVAVDVVLFGSARSRVKCERLHFLFLETEKFVICHSCVVLCGRLSPMSVAPPTSY
jgi:hypothetical protein